MSCEAAVLVVVLVLYISLGLASSTIFLDSEAATHLKEFFNAELQYSFIPNSKNTFVMNNPFEILQPSLYDEFEWRKNSVSTVSPDKRWCDLVDRIASSSTTYQFEDSGNTVSQYWEIFLEKYEWDDLVWDQQQQCEGCRYNYTTTLQETEKLMISTRQIFTAKAGCGANVQCLNFMNFKLVLNNMRYDLLKDQMVKEQALNSIAQTKSPERKINISKYLFTNSYIKDVGSDSDYFYYSVRFEPNNFLEKLKLTEIANKESFVNTWTIETYTFSEMAFCSVLLNEDNSILLEMTYNELDMPTVKILLTRDSNLHKKLMTQNGATCYNADIRIKGGFVKVIRPWMDLKIWAFKNMRVYQYSKGSWSDGNFNGEFSSVISNFLISQNITILRTDDQSVLEQISSPTIVGYSLLGLPYFPKSDSIYFRDSILISSNTSATDVSTSRSVFKNNVAQVPCGKQSKCYVNYNIFDEVTVQYLNQSFSDVTIATENAQNTYIWYDAQSNSLIQALIGLMVLEYIFVFTWPILLVFLCIFNYVNLCVLSFSKSKKSKLFSKKNTVPTTDIPLQDIPITTTSSIIVEGQQQQQQPVVAEDQIVGQTSTEDEQIASNELPANLVDVEDNSNIEKVEIELKEVEISSPEEPAETTTIATDVLVVPEEEVPVKEETQINKLDENIVEEPENKEPESKMEEIRIEESIVEEPERKETVADAVPANTLPLLSLSPIQENTSLPSSPNADSVKTPRDSFGNKVLELVNRFEKVREQTVESALLVEKSRKSYRRSQKFDFESMVQKEESMSASSSDTAIEKKTEAIEQSEKKNILQALKKMQKDEQQKNSGEQ